jgi:hypothetical protein
MTYRYSPDYKYYTAIVYDMGSQPIKIKRIKGYCSLANALAGAEVGMAIIERVEQDWILNRIVEKNPTVKVIKKKKKLPPKAKQRYYPQRIIKF